MAHPLRLLLSVLDAPLLAPVSPYTPSIRHCTASTRSYPHFAIHSLAFTSAAWMWWKKEEWGSARVVVCLRHVMEETNGVMAQVGRRKRDRWNGAVLLMEEEVVVVGDSAGVDFTKGRGEEHIQTARRIFILLLIARWILCICPIQLLILSIVCFFFLLHHRFPPFRRPVMVLSVTSLVAGRGRAHARAECL